MRASAAATHARLGGPGQWLLTLPADYIAGTQVLLRSVLAGAEPVILDEHADLTSAVAQLKQPPRYTSLVPTQLARLLQREPDAEALAMFDAVLVGGGAIEDDLRRSAQRRGVPVVATYGMSETCGGCVYDGVALDGVEVEIADSGRIRVAGPVLFDGYHGRADLTATVLQDGWFQTSDLGRIDGEGRLEVLGRVDDVVVSGGVNVPTGAVAARLREHRAVTAAEVVGAPDAEWGQVVVAVLSATGLDLEQVRDFVSATHPRAWAPRRLVLVDEVPLLPNGKPDRGALERLARRSAPPR